ncbi:MAG: carbonic anhydrase [Desulfomonile tiedjei]|nr:carbonic anhydrase [Desulfomonile tiedjei]
MKWVHYVVALTVCLAVLAVGSTSALAASAVKKPSPEKVMALLKEGNDRFAAGKPLHPHADLARAKQAAAENQANYAYATVLSCSDSRVPVEMIFDAGIMDIFVVRVAGNVANVDEIGTIEYGVAHVNTPVVVVLGHTQCGAVTAVTQELQGHGHSLERNIPPLIAGIKPAVRRAMADHPEVHGDAVVPHAIEANVWQSIEDLFMKSPVCRNLVNGGVIKVVGAMYDVGTGKVTWLPDANVEQILKKVEASPNRAKNPMATGGASH